MLLLHPHPGDALEIGANHADSLAFLRTRRCGGISLQVSGPIPGIADTDSFALLVRDRAANDRIQQPFRVRSTDLAAEGLAATIREGDLPAQLAQATPFFGYAEACAAIATLLGDQLDGDPLLRYPNPRKLTMEEATDPPPVGFVNLLLLADCVAFMHFDGIGRVWHLRAWCADPNRPWNRPVRLFGIDQS